MNLVYNDILEYLINEEPKQRVMEVVESMNKTEEVDSLNMTEEVDSLNMTEEVDSMNKTEEVVNMDVENQSSEHMLGHEDLPR